MQQLVADGRRTTWQRANPVAVAFVGRSWLKPWVVKLTYPSVRGGATTDASAKPECSSVSQRRIVVSVAAAEREGSREGGMLGGATAEIIVNEALMYQYTFRRIGTAPDRPATNEPQVP